MSTPLNFLQASVRADELVARQNIGIGTDSQSSELHIKADAPEIRLEDRVGAEASQTATRIYADSGNTYIQSGLNFTDGTPSSNIVFGSMGNATQFVNIGAHGIETTGNLFVNNLEFTQTQGLDQILNVSNTTSNIMTLTNTSDDALNVAGGMTLGSNLAVNTDDLFVDTQTGRVGIGTTNPQSALNVNFNDDNEFLVDDGKLVLGREENIIRRYNYELDGGPYTEGDASDYYLAREHKLVRNANLNYRNSGDGGARYDTHRIVMGYSNVYELGAGGYYPTYHAFKFQVAPTWDASEDVGEQDTKMIIQGDGNVGIGTAEPQNSLHLFKSGNEQTSGLFIEKQNSGTGTSQITFGVNASTENVGVAKAGIFFQRASFNGRGDLKFCIDNVDDANSVGVSDAALTIYRDGNVGIGKTNPTQKLDVNGYIKHANTSFLAYSDNGNANYDKDTPIILEETQFNVGSSYSTSTGAFTAPVSGYYQLNAVIFNNSSNGIQFSFLYRSSSSGTWDSLLLGGDEYVWSHPSTGASSSSVTLKLSSGNQIAIGHRNDATYTIYRAHTHFSGFLISPS